MNIKVCGITQVKQLKQLEGLSIDFARLDFQKESERFVDGKIPADELKESDFDIKKTGVFGDAEMIDMLDAIDNYGLDVIQLDGNESKEVCADLSEEVEEIKTFNLGDGKVGIDVMVADYDDVCEFIICLKTRRRNLTGKVYRKQKLKSHFLSVV